MKNYPFTNIFDQYFICLIIKIACIDTANLSDLAKKLTLCQTSTGIFSNNTSKCTNNVLAVRVLKMIFAHMTSKILLFVFFTVKSRCPKNGSTCSHLCLLVPGGFQCACPDNSTFIEGSQNICDAGNDKLWYFC